jgi:hypothetical protein
MEEEEPAYEPGCIWMGWGEFHSNNFLIAFHNEAMFKYCRGFFFG